MSVCPSYLRFPAVSPPDRPRRPPPHLIFDIVLPHQIFTPENSMPTSAYKFAFRQNSEWMWKYFCQLDRFCATADCEKYELRSHHQSSVQGLLIEKKEIACNFLNSNFIIQDGHRSPVVLSTQLTSIAHCLYERKNASLDKYFHFLFLCHWPSHKLTVLIK